MEYIIDCACIDSRAAFHRVLADTLHFPQWYGANLDALYDCLTEIGSETRLRLSNWDDSASYARGFSRVFAQAAQDNPFLRVELQKRS